VHILHVRIITIILWGGKRREREAYLRLRDVLHVDVREELRIDFLEKDCVVHAHSAVFVPRVCAALRRVQVDCAQLLEELRGEGFRNVYIHCVFIFAVIAARSVFFQLQRIVVRFCTRTEWGGG
jgi:hypothetical protein